MGTGKVAMQQGCSSTEEVKKSRQQFKVPLFAGLWEITQGGVTAQHLYSPTSQSSGKYVQVSAVRISAWGRELCHQHRAHQSMPEQDVVLMFVHATSSIVVGLRQTEHHAGTWKLQAPCLGLALVCWGVTTFQCPVPQFPHR